MLRYTLAAAALKLFSASALSERVYRAIGNSVGQRQRLAAGDLENRIQRGNLLLQLCRKHGAVRNGDRMLEIGTGWMHWYSLYLYLFYDLRITAFDVWDNRQFLALQATVEKLLPRFEQTPDINQRALQSLHTVLECKSFDDLYRSFGWEYSIEANGSLDAFGVNEFDFVTSFHVLEHVPAESIPRLTGDIFRTLKPGGFTIHQIGIDDHLTHYDAKASAKQYLKYSDGMWRLLFQNKVQYINRWQPTDWESAFGGAGFELVDKITKRANIGQLEIDSKYRSYPREDLECVNLTLVYRKPPL